MGRGYHSIGRGSEPPSLVWRRSRVHAREEGFSKAWMKNHCRKLTEIMEGLLEASLQEGGATKNNKQAE